MGAIATKQSPSYEFEIQVHAGPDKGARFRLKGSPIVIGRAKENHIPLAGDPKISRKHAEIYFTQNGIEIVDISGRKKMIVNGKNCEKAMLSNQSEIILGDSRLIFIISKNQPIPHSGAQPQWSSKLSSQAQPQLSQYPQSQSNKSDSAKKSSPTKRLILYGGIALLLYFVFSESNLKKKSKPELRTGEIVEKEIEKNKELQKLILKQKQVEGVNTPQFKEAQSSFVRGFRDFRNANYASAMESFQACLTLFKEHALCRRYFRLSYRKHTELIQYNMVLGQQYHEQGQYKKCAHQYRSAMILASKLSQTEYRQLYKQAESAERNCLLLVKDNY